MGEIDNTGAEGAGNDELRVECTTLLFELRLAIEATIVGIKQIATRPAAAPLHAEIGILLRLIEQGAEAINALDTVLESVLRRQAEELPS
jgi:hypothetical protein